MKHLINVIKCFFFIFILVISLLFINNVMESKYITKNSRWPTTSSCKQFYKMKKNSIDVLFLGSSVVVNAFIPQQIYNDHGIRCYNLGSEQQSIYMSYYWLKEALSYQKPKVVVLDVLFMWDLHSESPINMAEGFTRKCLDPMRWSPVKQEAVHNLCALDKSQSELSYYLTNFRYHSRWTDLKEYDFKPSMTDNNPLLGYAPIVGDGPDSYTPFEPSDIEATMEFHPLMQEYLDRIVELCRENNIKLVMIDMPGNGMHDGVHNAHVLYAKENNIDYMNLCTRDNYEKIGGELPVINIVGHPNVPGAVKLSTFMGNTLHDLYDLQPVYDEQYENTRGYYEHMLKNSALFNITDTAEYLNTINDAGYAVFISAKGDSSMALSNETIKKGLKQLGLTCSYEADPTCSYIATVIGKTVLDEESSPDMLSYTGSFREHNSVFTVSGCNRNSGNLSSIIIEGEEYSRDSTGLNITIYDLYTQNVIDQVTLDGTHVIH